MSEYKNWVYCQDTKGRTLDNLKFNVGSKTIYLFKMVDGVDYRRTLKIKSYSNILDESTRVRAQKKANQLIADSLRVVKRQEKVQLLIRDVISSIVNLYRAQRDAGSYAKGSYLAMARAFRRLDEYWGDKFPDEITREEWDKFQDWHEKYWPGQDQFNITKYMRVLINNCIEKGALQGKPKIKDRYAKRRREQRKKKKAWVYTNAEILALDRACKNDLERLALRLGYMMAFRISDCVELKWSRIILDEDPPVITFSEGEDKADFSGKCPIPDDVVSIIKTLPRISEWVFPKVHNLHAHIVPSMFDYRAIRDRASVRRGTFHSLRHYRLTSDFNNPKFTATQVCLTRRISLKTAMEHYCHVRQEDLELLRNAGSLKAFGENSQNNKISLDSKNSLGEK